jgi:hypothetical protein
VTVQGRKLTNYDCRPIVNPQFPYY